MHLSVLSLYLSIITVLAQLNTDEVIEEKEPLSSQTNTNKRKIEAPIIPDDAFFAMLFYPSDDLKFVRSSNKKAGSDSKYDGVWSIEEPTSSVLDGDYGLVLKSKARHHAVAINFNKIIDFNSHDKLVLQYEAKFQNSLDCGGGYIKLLSQQTPSLDLNDFNDKTPYTIMFGPDKCGLEQRIHFIIRHKNPITGEFEEKHAKKSKEDLERYFNDKKTHLFTLVLDVENKFEIYVDQVLVNSGSLLEDMEPQINPSKEIDDPSDLKPNDWDEREKIPDPLSEKPSDWDESLPEFILDESATKPDGWLDDESITIPDPLAEKPNDWDAEMDGEWEPAKIENPKCKDAPGCGSWTQPTIKNPKYKGKWVAPLIDNINYKGIWKARKIPNPHYFEDAQPYRRLTPVSAMGLELWSMTDEIVFDNFFFSPSKSDADNFASLTFYIKKEEERKADPKSQSVIDAIQEVTKEKPWIWGVVALVVALPLFLIIYYCCLSSKNTNKASVQRMQSRHKKTDEYSRDDKPKNEDSSAVSNKLGLESSDGEDDDEIVPHSPSKPNENDTESDDKNSQSGADNEINHSNTRNSYRADHSPSKRSTHSNTESNSPVCNDIEDMEPVPEELPSEKQSIKRRARKI